LPPHLSRHSLRACRFWVLAHRSCAHSPGLHRAACAAILLYFWYWDATAALSVYRLPAFTFRFHVCATFTRLPVLVTGSSGCSRSLHIPRYAYCPGLVLPELPHTTTYLPVLPSHTHRTHVYTAPVLHLTHLRRRLSVHAHMTHLWFSFYSAVHFLVYLSRLVLSFMFVAHGLVRLGLYHIHRYILVRFACACWIHYATTFTSRTPPHCRLSRSLHALRTPHLPHWTALLPPPRFRLHHFSAAAARIRLHTDHTTRRWLLPHRQRTLRFSPVTTSGCSSVAALPAVTDICGSHTSTPPFTFPRTADDTHTSLLPPLRFWVTHVYAHAWFATHTIHVYHTGLVLVYYIHSDCGSHTRIHFLPGLPLPDATWTAPFLYNLPLPSGFTHMVCLPPYSRFPRYLRLWVTHARYAHVCCRARFPFVCHFTFAFRTHRFAACPLHARRTLPSAIHCFRTHLPVSAFPFGVPLPRLDATFRFRSWSHGFLFCSRPFTRAVTYLRFLRSPHTLHHALHAPRCLFAFGFARFAPGHATPRMHTSLTSPHCTPHAEPAPRTTRLRYLLRDSPRGPTFTFVPPHILHAALPSPGTLVHHGFRFWLRFSFHVCRTTRFTRHIRFSVRAPPLPAAHARHTPAHRTVLRFAFVALFVVHAHAPHATRFTYRWFCICGFRLYAVARSRRTRLRYPTHSRFAFCWLVSTVLHGFAAPHTRHCLFSGFAVPSRTFTYAWFRSPRWLRSYAAALHRSRVYTQFSRAPRVCLPLRTSAFASGYLWFPMPAFTRMPLRFPFFTHTFIATHSPSHTLNTAYWLCSSTPFLCIFAFRLPSSPFPCTPLLLHTVSPLCTFHLFLLATALCTGFLVLRLSRGFGSRARTHATLSPLRFTPRRIRFWFTFLVRFAGPFTTLHVPAGCAFTTGFVRVLLPLHGWLTHCVSRIRARHAVYARTWVPGYAYTPRYRYGLHSRFATTRCVLLRLTPYTFTTHTFADARSTRTLHSTPRVSFGFPVTFTSFPHRSRFVSRFIPPPRFPRTRSGLPGSRVWFYTHRLSPYRGLLRLHGWFPVYVRCPSTHLPFGPLHNAATPVCTRLLHDGPDSVHRCGHRCLRFHTAVWLRYTPAFSRLRVYMPSLLGLQDPLYGLDAPYPPFTGLVPVLTFARSPPLHACMHLRGFTMGILCLHATRTHLLDARTHQLHRTARTVAVHCTFPAAHTFGYAFTVCLYAPTRVATLPHTGGTEPLPDALSTLQPRFTPLPPLPPHRDTLTFG